jgi:hypothetical protein
MSEQSAVTIKLAGTTAIIAGFDELWSYDSEAARRLWDEPLIRADQMQRRQQTNGNANG